MDKQPAVYILADKRNGTLYVGVTSDLVKRVYQHKNGFVDGFTKKYGIKRLVYYETHVSMLDAIMREKRLKKGTRKRKIKLIEDRNPYWNDLYEQIT